MESPNDKLNKLLSTIDNKETRDGINRMYENMTIYYRDILNRVIDMHYVERIAYENNLYEKINKQKKDIKNANHAYHKKINTFEKEVKH